MTNDSIIKLFMENAAKVAADPVRVSSTREMNAVLNKIVAKAGGVYVRKKTDIEKSIRIPKDRIVSDYFEAAFTVEQVDGAIAETGSVICSSFNGRAVQSSLLPSHHVAIVKSDTIYETMDEYFASLSESPPTNITFVTGPSRTADIELTLTTGVHGPEQVSIIIV
ncbi:MAG: lactate utilization protein C [Desulfomonilaceae bacterium]